MFEFLEDIKLYLENCFANDTSISATKRPKIYSGYQVAHEPSATQPEIQVRVIDNSEQQEFTSFCNKHANTISIQIMAFSGKLRIAGVDRNPIDASMILGDKVEKFIYNLIYSKETAEIHNPNIYNGGLISTSPSLPMNDGGTIYMSALRFTFVVASPYNVG